jgi:hypothetical protein
LLFSDNVKITELLVDKGLDFYNNLGYLMEKAIKEFKDDPTNLSVFLDAIPIDNFSDPYLRKVLDEAVKLSKAHNKPRIAAFISNFIQENLII